MEENFDKHAAFEKDLWEIAEKHGIEDWFFSGIDMENNTWRAYKFGHEKTQTSNAMRYRALLGAVEDWKINMTLCHHGILEDDSV